MQYRHGLPYFTRAKSHSRTQYDIIINDINNINNNDTVNTSFCLLEV